MNVKHAIRFAGLSLLLLSAGATTLTVKQAPKATTGSTQAETEVALVVNGRWRYYRMKVNISNDVRKKLRLSSDARMAAFVQNTIDQHLHMLSVVYGKQDFLSRLNGAEFGVIALTDKPNLLASFPMGTKVHDLTPEEADPLANANYICFNNDSGTPSMCCYVWKCD